MSVFTCKLGIFEVILHEKRPKTPIFLHFIYKKAKRTDNLARQSQNTAGSGFRDRIPIKMAKIGGFSYKKWSFLYKKR
jgi:hypothetical protein